MNESRYYLLVFVILMTSFLSYQVYKRNKALSDNGVEGICKVVEIKKLTKGVTTRQEVAIIEYYVKGGYYRTSVAIFPNTKKGTCYKTLYSSENPKVVEVDFEESIPCNF